LKCVATHAGEAVALLFRLHAFGNDRQTHGAAERDDGLSDGGAAFFGENIADERAIDLDLVEGQFLQVSQRRVAGAKVVEREPQSMGLEFLHLVADVLHVFNQNAFGEFEAQFGGVCPGAIESRQNLLDKFRLMELPGADVD